MATRLKNTAERGKFKEEIHKALYKSGDIKELLLGDVSGMSAYDISMKFKSQVKSHLFVDDTIEETNSFIFYDVIMPSLANNIKNCKVLMYAICHRDILDNYYKDGYYGNRADILSQMIENVLINDDDTANSFGIGRLSLDGVDIYNGRRFYGCVMYFKVPNFR